MALLVNGLETAALVELDGLSRVIADTEGGQYVMFLNGGNIAQTLTAAEWLAQRGPLPDLAGPTPQQIADAIAARETARQTALAAAATKRAQIVALAQSSVGVRVDLLTNAQIRALFGIILWEAGALDATLNVRPLVDWVQA